MQEGLAGEEVVLTGVADSQIRAGRLDLHRDEACSQAREGGDSLVEGGLLLPEPLLRTERHDISVRADPWREFVPAPPNDQGWPVPLDHRVLRVRHEWCAGALERLARGKDLRNSSSRAARPGCGDEGVAVLRSLLGEIRGK